MSILNDVLADMRGTTHGQLYEWIEYDAAQPESHVPRAQRP
jgi:hypothetical protein